MIIVFGNHKNFTLFAIILTLKHLLSKTKRLDLSPKTGLWSMFGIGGYPRGIIKTRIGLIAHNNKRNPNNSHKNVRTILNISFIDPPWNFYFNQRYL